MRVTLVCPYTGPDPLFRVWVRYSAATEVDHRSLPFRGKTLGTTAVANKVVCFRSANREKGKSTPYEKFGKTPEWEGIAQRASKLPPNKRWRFGADARERFDEQGGFLARQLNETAWLASLSKEYLSAVVRPDNIWVTPGRLTSMIRYKWGLNELLPGYDREAKKRTDHRHHAIDALVVALTDRSLLQRMSSAYDETRSRIIVPPPWEGFREELKAILDKVVVSYKPDHGMPGKRGSTSGQLHNDTAYGLIEFSEDGPSKVVVRKNLDKLKRSDLEPVKEDVPRKGVRDLTLRSALLELWDRVHWEGGKAADFARAASKGVLLNGRPQPVRRVRVVDEQRVIPIRHGSEKQHSKGYLPDSNEFADVWQMPADRDWQMVVVSRFYANQRGFDLNQFRPHPAAKRLLRLQINDMGAIGEGLDRRIVRVRKINDRTHSLPTVVLDSHSDAQPAKEEEFSAPKLRRKGFRKISVDEIGRVRDPGPPEQ